MKKYMRSPLTASSDGLGSFVMVGPETKSAEELESDTFNLLNDLVSASNKAWNITDMSKLPDEITKVKSIVKHIEDNLHYWHLRQKGE